MTNALGDQVWEGTLATTIRIDLTQFSKGIYLISAHTAKGIWREKLVVQ